MVSSQLYIKNVQFVRGFPHDRQLAGVPDMATVQEAEEEIVSEVPLSPAKKWWKPRNIFGSGDTGVGNCPILGILDHDLIVAIIDHIPNGWVMFNGEI